jgi:hypothetical protein
VRRVGRKHRKQRLYLRILLWAVEMPTRKYVLDHVSAGFPVVLDVSEPRL